MDTWFADVKLLLQCREDDQDWPDSSGRHLALVSLPLYTSREKYPDELTTSESGHA